MSTTQRTMRAGSFAVWLSCVFWTENQINVVSASSTYKVSVFNVSSSDNSFSDHTVDCGLVDLCHILCNEPSGCTSMTINASLASDLILECSADSSCREYNLLSPGPSGNVTVSCTDSHSCYQSLIELSAAKHVHLNCSADWGCHDMDLHVADALSMDIRCREANGCRSTGFYISNVTESRIEWYFWNSSNIGIVAEDNYNSKVEVRDAVLVDIMCSGTSGFGGGSTTLYFENVGDIAVVSTGYNCMNNVDATIISTDNTSIPQQFDVKCIGLKACFGLMVDAGSSLSRY